MVWSSAVRRVLKAVGFSLALLAIAGAGTWLILAASEGRWPWAAPPTPPPPEFQPDRYQLPEEPFADVHTVPVAQVKEAIEPGELVLGVTVGDESRAYPLNALNEMLRHKVVNDTLGGVAIVATWCDACHSGIVYDRTVEGRPLTLGVSGQLWKDSMVLYDQQTRTLWSQLGGEAKQGPLKGTRLRRIPSVVTDWESWCRQYPRSTVLLLPRAPGGSHREFRRDFYQHPENFVLGLADGDRARAWGLDVLRERTVLNDEWDGRPVLVVFDPASSMATVYERRLPSSTEGRQAGGVLTFRLAGEKLADKESGSTWNRVTGEAESGPLRGQRLSRLPAVLATRKAWEAFHPPRAEP
jgi:hypothetical protein